MKKGRLKKLYVLISVIALMVIVPYGVNAAELSAQNETKNSARELTVCLVDPMDSVKSVIVPYYETLYPDVEVRVVSMSLNKSYDYKTEMQKRTEAMHQLREQILAGDGPDLLLMNENISSYNTTLNVSLFPSVEDAMVSGAFADLTPYMQKDASFDKNELLQPVFDAGIYDGKQLIAPITCYIPTVVSTKGTAKALGVATVDGCVNVDEFLQAASSTEAALNVLRSDPQSGFISGVPTSVIDFASNASQAFSYETSKSSFEIFALNQGGSDVEARINIYAAVTNSSESKQEAWNFISLMLSDKAQTNVLRQADEQVSGGMWMNAFPVREASFENIRLSSGFNNADVSKQLYALSQKIKSASFYNADDAKQAE